MKVIILAAGRGKNLNPLTETRPKPMISICGKPVLEYIIRGLVETGNRDLQIVVGHGANSIKKYFERGERFANSILSKRSKPGLGDAVLLRAKKFVPGERFFLVYADIPV